MYNLLARVGDSDDSTFFSQESSYKKRRGFMRFFLFPFLRLRTLFCRKKRLLGYLLILLSFFLFFGYFFLFVPAVRSYQQQ